MRSIDHICLNVLGLLLAAFIFCSCEETSDPASLAASEWLPAEGQIELSPGISIPAVGNGYQLWMPPGGQAAGMIVFTHARNDTSNSEPVINLAASRDLAVLYASTNNRLEFFFEDRKMDEILSYITSVVDQFDIPADNLLYCGMSLEGTRALKLAMHAQRQPGINIVPKAIAICDAPLDMVRFHRECVRAMKLSFNPITANEGEWVSGYLTAHLGDPAESLEAYIEYSPYCRDAVNGGNASSFKDIAIRAYTEPDVNWWINTRRKDYYSMNSIDLAALINELKIMGNRSAELVVTQNKGYHPDGTRHPHSWSIVNEEELIDWFINLP